jgi:hypothetical protein
MMYNKQQMNFVLYIFFLFVTFTYQNNNIPISYVKFSLNQSTLKFSIHYLFYNLSPIFLAKSQILKFLQKKNISHKSSDDKPAPYVCC